MANISIGKYEDFEKLFLNAPQKVKDILKKTYPNFYNKLASKYREVVGSRLKQFEKDYNDRKSEPIKRRPDPKEFKAPTRTQGSSLVPKNTIANVPKVLNRGGLPAVAPNSVYNPNFILGQGTDTTYRPNFTRVETINPPALRSNTLPIRTAEINFQRGDTLGNPEPIPNVNPNETPKAQPLSWLNKAGGKIKAFGKGTIGTIGKFAPIQGISNLVSSDSDLTDKLSGAGMIGAGGAAIAGVPYANVIAASLVGGDMLKKHVAAPVGNKIGEMIYGTGDQYGSDEGLADPYNYEGTSLNTNLTPEQYNKITAYNKGVLARTKAEADASLARGNEEIANYDRLINGSPVDPQVESDMRGGEYTVPPTYGISPESFYNAQEGGLNNSQDNLYLNQYKPSLKPIVEPVNYANLYQQRANQLINELQGGQQTMDINPYSQLRGMENNQLAPVPTQNIREDVLPDYLDVMSRIRGGQQGLDYGAVLQQYKDAVAADQKQNQLNRMINTFGVFGTPSSRAPISYVGYDGKLKQIELDQPNQVTPLPTDTTTNANKLTGELAIRQAQQKQEADQYKQYIDILKAQQEREDMLDAANALGQATGYDPRAFLSTDYGKAIIEQMIHPNVQAQANIMEAKGKAPTQAKLKQAEQLQGTAGELDKIQLQSQYDVMLANINNNAKLEEQAMVQGGMDRRMAHQLATQRAINMYTQMMENTRALDKNANALELQRMKNQSLENVANINADAKIAGIKPTLTYPQELVKTMVGLGMPTAQIIKTMQGLGYGDFSLSEEERAELDR